MDQDSSYPFSSVLQQQPKASNPPKSSTIIAVNCDPTRRMSSSSSSKPSGDAQSFDHLDSKTHDLLNDTSSIDDQEWEYQLPPIGEVEYPRGHLLTPIGRRFSADPSMFMSPSVSSSNNADNVQRIRVVCPVSGANNSGPGLGHGSSSSYEDQSINHRSSSQPNVITLNNGNKPMIGYHDDIYDLNAELDPSLDKYDSTITTMATTKVRDIKIIIHDCITIGIAKSRCERVYILLSNEVIDFEWCVYVSVTQAKLPPLCVSVYLNNTKGSERGISWAGALHNEEEHDEEIVAPNLLPCPK